MFKIKKSIFFVIAMLMLPIYEVSMIYLELDGVSLLKLILTFLIWVSCILAIMQFVKSYGIIKSKLPPLVFFVFLLLLLWNVLSILQTIFFGNVSVSTLFGNVFTALAMLLPIVMVFSESKLNLKAFVKYSFIISLTGIVIFIGMYVTNGGKFAEWELIILLVLLQPVIFLIPMFSFYSTRSKLLLLISSILLFFIAIEYSNRTMMIREIALVLCAIIIFICQKVRLKIVPRFAFILLFVPFLLLKLSIDSGESVITKYLSNTDDVDFSVDTRTFLYTELYKDLLNHDRILVGKGAYSTYYSDYFSIAEGDSPNRLDIEVGVLAMLLKGGLIAVFLNLFMILVAIYYSFFRNNNLFVFGVGLILAIHFILLFLENRIGYTSYNFSIWFLVGIALSNEIRTLKNKEILQMLRKV